jgi:hypothetical protein
MKGYNIYGNNTDNGGYHDGEDGEWIPIINQMEVKNKISRDVKNINIETTGVINFNRFKFSSVNKIYQILDSDGNPIMTISKGVGIKFNYPI